MAPKVSELYPDMVRIPNLLQHFLSYLLHGSAMFEKKPNRSEYYILCTQWSIHNLKTYPSAISHKINDRKC